MQLNNDTKPKLTIRVSWAFICTILLIAQAVTIYLWKPWNNITETRKISVVGEATIKSAPDEYKLYPYFEFANADRTKANEDLIKQSTATAAKLKELGVKDEQIKSSTSGYDRYTTTVPVDNSANTLTLQYTITVSDKDIAQKVQDYMLSQKAKGQISPQASFSTAKQKELESQGREKAVADAKAKADTTARLLNAKVGKAITVSDGSSYGGPIAYGVSDMSVKSSSASGPAVQPGQNDFSYTVSVEYELK